MAADLLQWHDGFHASLQIELQRETAHLEFHSEHELYKKALRIDTLIIKNSDDTPVQKNIGKIFRKYNLIEYKSPDDYLSINDFYKVYGYACLFQSNTENTHGISMNDVTITFVCSHFPRKMLKILKAERNIDAEQTAKGIYKLKNDPISMQILLISKLPPEENLWLSSLTRNLPMNRNTELLLREYQKHKDSVLYQSAMELIIQANKEIMEEDCNMVCDVLKEIFADEWKEKELEMRQKESQIQQKESLIQQKESLMQKKESQIQQMESQMQKKESQIQQKESLMQKKESLMQKKESLIQQMESQIRERELLLNKKEENIKIRMEKGENRLNSLIQLLLHDNLMDDLKKASEDRTYLEQMYQRYGL